MFKFVVTCVLVLACGKTTAPVSPAPAPVPEADAGAFTCDYPVCDDRCLRIFRDSKRCCKCE